MKIRMVMVLICCLMSAAVTGTVSAQPNDEGSTTEVTSEQHLEASGTDMLSTTIVGVWHIIKYDSENRILMGQAIFGADGTLTDALSLFGSANEWKAQDGKVLLLKPAPDNGKSVDAYGVALLGASRINLAKGHDTYFLHKSTEISRAGGSVTSTVKTIADASLSVAGQQLTR